MFCYQCQEAAQGKGCTVKGVCGKTSDVSGLQDLLIYLTRENAKLMLLLQAKGLANRDYDRWAAESLFMTITNANFDLQRFEKRVGEALHWRDRLRKEVLAVALPMPEGLSSWTATTLAEMEAKAAQVGTLATENEDERSLRSLLLFGLKGMAAYVEHAYRLGFEDATVYAFLHRALVATADDRLSAEELTQLVMECGSMGVAAMALLSEANTSTYGNPEMSRVKLGVGQRPGILISGHDLRDMQDLLEQTKDSGVDVYTHSEMLPAHYYPAFKKYSHFVGNYGGAWWQQVSDFEHFHGPIVFTTNCIVPPRAESTYSKRVFTTGAAGFPGFDHISEREDGKAKDFSKVIALAQSCEAPSPLEEGEIVGGFAHAQVFALADKVVEAVRSGAIRKFYVMAGCDGRMKSREYYTTFAQQLPKDTVILTAGCAKYRYNKLPLGDIGGIPRVLDAGQCNDSYSLVLIALKLKEVFGLNDINDLPIEYNIAWYEQKAVIVLLALLSLGVKDIHLGPTLPAFLSPAVVQLLVDQFGIAGPIDLME